MEIFKIYIFIITRSNARFARGDKLCFEYKFRNKNKQIHVAIYIATAVAAMTTLPTNQIANKTRKNINFNKGD